jgi:hypothetical protein
MSYKEHSFLPIFAIAMTGCATTRGQQDAAQTAAPAGAAAAALTVAPVVPLTNSPASVKRLVLNMTGPAFVTQAKDWTLRQRLPLGVLFAPLRCGGSKLGCAVALPTDFTACHTAHRRSRYL